MTIKKKKCMRVISVILSLLLISLLLYAFISVIVPEVSRSIIAISYQFPYYIRNLTQFSNKLLQDNPTLNDLFIQFVDDYSGEFSNFLNKTIIPQTQEILKHISLSLLSFLKMLWNVVIGEIISVYVLFNKELFAGQAKKIAYALLNTDHANTFIKDIRFTSQTFIGFLSGKIVDYRDFMFRWIIHFKDAICHSGKRDRRCNKYYTFLRPLPWSNSKCITDFTGKSAEMPVFHYFHSCSSAA